MIYRKRRTKGRTEHDVEKDAQIWLYRKGDIEKDLY